MDFVVRKKQINFKGGQVRSAQCLGAQILSSAQFWCKNQTYDALSNLNCMFPLHHYSGGGGYNPYAWEKDGFY